MEKMETWLESLTGGDETMALMLQVFIVVLAVAVVNFVLRRLLNKLEARTQTTSNPWDSALVSAARQPLTVLAWIVGLAFAARLMKSDANSALFEVIAPIRSIGVIACLSWFLVRFVGNVQEVVISRQVERGEAVDRTTVDAVGKLLRVSVLITAVLVGLQSLGFSISGVLAFGGIGGIAVGFAAKDLLANFFGGLMLYLDRPFVVGEWIRSPDREIEGTVEEIGWRLTRIRTFDKRPLYVPNAVFAQIAVENPARMTNRRIKETLGLRYDDLALVAVIVADIKTMLRSHPAIDEKQTLIVNFVEFAASSLDIMIYTFTRTTNWIEFHEVKQDVMLKIAGIVARHGGEIAFPTRTLHIASEPAGAGPATAGH
jgi:MscS family membrane protein